MLGFDAIGKLAIGQVQQSTDINVGMTGVAATGQIGGVAPTVSAFNFTGVTATGQVDAVVAQTAVTLVGQAVASHVGTISTSVTVQTVVGVSATGVASGVGNKAVYALPAGVEGTSALGTITITSQNGVLAGVIAFGHAGTAIANPAGNPVGVSATGIAGTATTDLRLVLASVEATGFAASVIANARAIIAGVAAQGQVGDLLASNTVGSGIYVPENSLQRATGQKPRPRKRPHEATAV